MFKTFKKATAEHWTKCGTLLSSGPGHLHTSAWLALSKEGNEVWEIFELTVDGLVSHYRDLRFYSNYNRNHHRFWVGEQCGLATSRRILDSCIRMNLRRPGVTVRRSVRWLKNCNNDNKWRNASACHSFVITGYNSVFTNFPIWNIQCGSRWNRYGDWRRFGSCAQRT